MTPISKSKKRLGSVIQEEGLVLGNMRLLCDSLTKRKMPTYENSLVDEQNISTAMARKPRDLSSSSLWFLPDEPWTCSEKNQPVFSDRTSIFNSNSLPVDGEPRFICSS